MNKLSIYALSAICISILTPLQLLAQGFYGDAGTHYYILDLRGMDGNNYPEQGAVALLR